MRQDEITKSALEAVLKIALVALLIVWCFEIIHPFAVPIVWGIIIAVGIFPIYGWVHHRVTKRGWLAATLITLALLLILVFPVAFLVTVLVDNLHVVSDHLRAGTLIVPPPPQGIKDWPVIGTPLEKAWSMAAENLEVAVQQITPQLQEFVKPLLGAAATVGLNIVKFIVAVVLAGVFLTFSEEGYRLSRDVGRRLVGQQGGGAGRPCRSHDAQCRARGPWRSLDSDKCGRSWSGRGRNPACRLMDSDRSRLVRCSDRSLPHHGSGCGLYVLDQ